MNGDNIMKFMKKSNHYVFSINRALRNVKSDVLFNFINLDSLGITVVTCKVIFPSDLQVIENYINNINCIDTMEVDVPCLPQFKSYLKIIGIPYFQDDFSNHLMLKAVKYIIKQNQIFNNIVLVSKLCIIKMSPKLDMVIVWLDIWNIQSGSKARGLNCYFNVGSYITTIKSTNMNLGVLQYKNC